MGLGTMQSRSSQKHVRRDLIVQHSPRKETSCRRRYFDDTMGVCLISTRFGIDRLKWMFAVLEVQVEVAVEVTMGAKQPTPSDGKTPALFDPPESNFS